MSFVLRQMQREAVDRCVDFFLNGKPGRNAIAVAPTSFGKSLLISNVAAELDAPVLVFQPSKEILEQNLAKFHAYGYRPSIYSASMSRKTVGDVTLATIGSVAGSKVRGSKSHLFQDFPYVIVDEADLAGAKKGRYKSFFEELEGVKILGVTATPFRQSSNSFGTQAKFLTRTRPRIFHDVCHYTQVGEMVEQRYWAPLEYHHVKGFDRHAVKTNSTGADFDDRALQLHFWHIGFQDKIVKVIERLKANNRRNALIFTRFVKEAVYVAGKVDDLAVVTAETSVEERAAIAREFRAGRIWGVINVGVFTTGFDYPELETIVVARPTKSLRLWYQIVGRGVRIHPDKESCWIVDMVGLTGEFGKVEDLTLYCEGETKWSFWGKPGGVEDRQLTNCYLTESGNNRCKKCGQRILFWARHKETGNSAPMARPAFGIKPNIAILSVEGRTCYEILPAGDPQATHLNHYALCGKAN